MDSANPVGVAAPLGASRSGDAGGPGELVAAREGLRVAWLYSVASLGIGFFYGFNNATLPLILNRFTESPLLIGLLSSTRSIEGTVVQPVVGAWSDRTWTRLGRRRPFMALGIPLSALFFILAAHAPNLPLLVAAIVLFSLLFNAAVDPYNALLADLFPPERRSMVTGLAKVIEFAGTVGVVFGGAVLAERGQIPLTFYLVAIGMVATFTVTVAALREPRVLPAAGSADGETAHPPMREYAARLLRHRAAFRFLVCLFCFRFGSNAILPYLTLFAVHVIGTGEGMAQYLFLGLVLATGLMLVPAGLLAARRGRRPVLMAGVALTAVVALAGLVIRDVPQTLVVIVLAGIANAGITATDWPLLTELVPADEVGVFAGLKTAFESVAIPASVLLTSQFIELWGYRAIFVVLTIGAVAALVLLRTVETPDRRGAMSRTAGAAGS
jgi:maltose/moltooligosaccharide transporter